MVPLGLSPPHPCMGVKACAPCPLRRRLETANGDKETEEGRGLSEPSVAHTDQGSELSSKPSFPQRAINVSPRVRGERQLPPLRAMAKLRASPHLVLTMVPGSGISIPISDEDVDSTESLSNFLKVTQVVSSTSNPILALNKGNNNRALYCQGKIQLKRQK